MTLFAAMFMLPTRPAKDCIEVNRCDAGGEEENSYSITLTESTRLKLLINAVLVDVNPTKRARSPVRGSELSSKLRCVLTSSNAVCGKLSLSDEVSVFSSARYGQLHQLCNFSFRGVNGGRGGVFPEREEIVLGGSRCCLSPFWLSRRHFLRALDRFISAPSEVISNRRRGFVNRRF